MEGIKKVALNEGVFKLEELHNFLFKYLNLTKGNVLQLFNYKGSIFSETDFKNIHLSKSHSLII